jgi:hypothetical protein
MCLLLRHLQGTGACTPDAGSPCCPCMHSAQGAASDPASPCRPCMHWAQSAEQLLRRVTVASAECLAVGSQSAGSSGWVPHWHSVPVHGLCCFLLRSVALRPCRGGYALRPTSAQTLSLCENCDCLAVAGIRLSGCWMCRIATLHPRTHRAVSASACCDVRAASRYLCGALAH